MAKFKFPTSNGNPISQFATALTGRRLGLAGAIHPCRAIALGTAKLEASLKNFVELVERSELTVFGEDEADGNLSRAFEDLCYCTTEIMDIYVTVIPSAINLRPTSQLKAAEQNYVKTVKNRRRDWSIICNKIKHEHNVLVRVNQKALDTGLVARGFSLHRPTESDSLKINLVECSPFQRTDRLV